MLKEAFADSVRQLGPNIELRGYQDGIKEALSESQRMNVNELFPFYRIKEINKVGRGYRILIETDPI